VSPRSVSVVLPTMNRAEDLAAFLPSLRAQTRRPDELVVVDAGEPVQALLEQGLEGSGIRLVYLRSEPGTSLQRNLGIERASGEVLFFLDDDMVLRPDYVERSLACFDLPMDPPVGGVMGSQVNIPPDGPAKRAIYGLFGISHTAPGDVPRLYVHGGMRFLAEPSRTVPIPAAATGRVAYLRACFETERFAEFLPGYTFAEDVELAFRIARRWSLVHCPEARLEHHHSPAGRVGYGDRISRVMYARWYFFARHRPRDPRHLAALAWCHTGEVAQLALVGLLRKGAPPAELLRGIARGYRLCLADLRRQG